jgi:hypothetical protein
MPKNLVDIVSWDHRDVPEAEQIQNAIQIGGRFCWYYEDGSDTYHLAFFRNLVMDEEEAHALCVDYFAYVNGADPEDMPSSHHKATDR